MQNLKQMMSRVNHGISKKAAANVENAWKAVLRADTSNAGPVKLEPADYAIVYNYMAACAKGAGVI